MLFKLPLLSLAIEDDRLLRPLPPKLSVRPVPREGLIYPPVGKTWRSLTLPACTSSRTSSLPVEERGGENRQYVIIYKLRFNFSYYFLWFVA